MSKASNNKKRRTFVDLSDDNLDFVAPVKVQKNVNKAPAKVIKKTSTLNNNNSSKRRIDNNMNEREISHSPRFSKSESRPSNSYQSEHVRKEIPAPVNNIEEYEEVTDNYQYQNERTDDRRSTVINDAFQIVSEEPLNKGFHFYSNDRVMDKVKRCAKEKNIKLSKLITMILDKAIREE